MAPFKRYPGLRVAAVASVASVASFLVLGLQTPASAASPTISSFSPTSGPAGCVVVITGTNFKDPIVTSVDIGGTPDCWELIDERPRPGAHGTRIAFVHPSALSGVLTELVEERREG